MKKKSILLFLWIMVFSSCQMKTNVIEEYVAPTMSLTASIESIEDLASYANAIVRAEFVEKEDFSETVEIFKFKVVEDFLGTTDEKIIHVHEAAGTQYIKGKIYYLFLSGQISSSYPYTVYARCGRFFLVGESKDGYTFYGDNTLGLEEITDLSHYLYENIVEPHKYNVAAIPRLVRETVTDACENADVILVGKVTDVEPIPNNPYVCTAFYQIVEVKKGVYDKVTFARSDDPKLQDAAGVYTPNVLTSIKTNVDDQLIILLQRDENGILRTYSYQHSNYLIGSKEGKLILETLEHHSY